MKGSSVADRLPSRLLIAALLSLLYVVTRYGCLGRELGYEEGFFLAPGLTLFHSGHYRIYWGELNPDISPFHKPPLTSLLLGLFSLASFDPVAGARLVPFLAGWMVCLAPYLVTGSWAPSVVVLAAPFLYGASSQMQTDPTGVLAGFTIFSAGALECVRDSRRGDRMIATGLLVLWLTKFEAALMATACTGALALLLPAARRRAALRLAAMFTLAGAGLLCALSAMLAWTSARPAVEAWSGIFGTTLRIVSGTVGHHLEAADSGAQSRRLLWQYAADFRVPELLLCCWLPTVAAFFLAPAVRRERRILFVLAACACIPMLGIFGVAYIGDGYPRYLLIAVPPSLLALGVSIALLEGRVRWTVTAATLLAALLLMAPDTLRAMRSPGSPNAFRGERGSRLSAETVAAFTEPGDVILAPEIVLPYLSGRRVLNIESFEPYPELHDAALRYRGQIKAALLRPDSARSPLIRQLIAGMEEQGAESRTVDSFIVYLPGSAPPDCSQAQTPVLRSAAVRPGPNGAVAWALRGGCWDTHSVEIEFRGRGCDAGCVIPESAITRKTAVALEGVADLPRGASFQVRVSARGAWSQAATVAIPPR